MPGQLVGDDHDVHDRHRKYVADIDPCMHLHLHFAITGAHFQVPSHVHTLETPCLERLCHRQRHAEPRLPEPHLMLT